ncbi:MAG: bifunctional hydroxymethylpyrimidine kinase/phosphomethylpyrimidine kinase [Hyphomicrobiaceae bacterium]|nr:bifunctional hydroxymethylpyrimidine kinase/phosphomethylpyrimidine kinase [Hyphomicrobiaceae bacterium]
MADRPPPIPIALTIAGSDSSGGAGIQADLKTFSAFGVYGASVLTALTAQSTRGVDDVLAIPPAFVAAQIDAVLPDLAVGAAKTGMLANAGIIRAVAGALERHAPIPLVCDPVMVATSGDVLLEPAAIDAMRERIIPRATLLTPNIPEAARLLGCAEAAGLDEMARQAEALRGLGCGAVLLKGGHGTSAVATDLLAHARGVTPLEAPRIATRSTHGTGCTLAAAITALLAAGEPLEQAVRRAKTYVWRALEAGAGLVIGHGSGPVDHLFAIRRQPPPA